MKNIGINTAHSKSHSSFLELSLNIIPQARKQRVYDFNLGLVKITESNKTSKLIQRQPHFRSFLSTIVNLSNRNSCIKEIQRKFQRINLALTLQRSLSTSDVLTRNMLLTLTDILHNSRKESVNCYQGAVFRGSRFNLLRMMTRI